MPASPGLDVDVRKERREHIVVGQRRRAAQVEVELAADVPAADFGQENVRPHKGVSGGDAELPAGDPGQSWYAVERDAPGDEPVSVVHGTAHQDGMRYELHAALQRIDLLFSSG